MSKVLKNKSKIKKVLKDTSRTCKYLSKLPSMYVLVKWADYAVLACYYSGYTDKNGIPYVYEFRDYNGIGPQQYVAIPITEVTSGATYVWSPSKEVLEVIRNELRKAESK